MKRALPLLVAALAAFAPRASAHEVRPAYLELRQTGEDTFDVLWKVPASGDDLRLGLYVGLPDGCTKLTEPRGVFVAGSYAERWRVKRLGGLSGGTIHIAGLAGSQTDVLIHIHYSDGRSETHLLRPDTPWVKLSGASSMGGRALAYLRLGIEHILLGVDHLLFVLGLLLIVGNRWMLIKTITAFTLAHSLTLAIATLGYAHAPLAPLNAAIALSILFLGPEIVRVWRGETSFTIRHPWIVAFAFGLLHGFGFASGLNSMGLPKAEIPLALFLFNVGVEIGQLGFVLMILRLERSFRLLEIRWPRFALALPGYTVGVLGAYWTIQRAAMMLAGPR
ncbi:MAG: HupE/UreJ family protein [Candidatus Eisenbacteria bacterium]|uniref:HupE/UreJ family protein n=1 Tax=Eiseniibacteriota bacterium TaxID=2212470 RepID=A0A538T194_UNCEI|nr:MAG: HupE/UreJ family protein [Candidatus Eisenbacteria bacterium]